jgi:hypothetical protein
VDLKNVIKPRDTESMAGNPRRSKCSAAAFRSSFRAAWVKIVRQLKRMKIDENMMKIGCIMVYHIVTETI